jgi:hypothetical protein
MSANDQPSFDHVVLEFRDECPPGLESVAAQHPDVLTVVTAKSLSGFDYVTQVIVTASPLVVGLLTPIITEHVRAKREVRVKKDGAAQSSKDASLADLLDQLQRLLGPDDHRRDPGEPDS